MLGKADTRGRAGGLKGGLARALSLNPNDRSKIAWKTSMARWHPKVIG